MFHCQFCHVKKFSRVKFWSHLEHLHQHQADFVVSCDIPDCVKNYTSVPALRTHFHRKHPPSSSKASCSVPSVHIDNDDDNDDDLSLIHI